MKANFQINLPSIPGKNIKFKIQDIKSASFGTQKARFPDNKALLTKKFVQSFHNFHETKREDDQETQPQSQLAKSTIHEKKQLNFRSIVPENRKFLIPVYAQLKKQEAEKTEKSLDPKLKSVGGYSFAKAGKNEQNQEQEEIQDNEQEEKGNYSLTQNYYFTSGQKPQWQNQKLSRKPRPSAVFKNETRKRVYQRIEFSIVPGPGAYLKEKPKQKKKQKNVPQTFEVTQKNSLKDYKHLKDVITKVLVEEKQQYEQDEFPVNKQLKQDHMFVLDDRDRFGDQIFPIAPKLKVPGPGSYQVNDSLEDKAKKLLLVQQQRKLLKQWFNN